MDMRDFAAKWLKPDQVRDGPVRARVVSVFKDEKYNRPVLELDNGSQFRLNEGNNTALMKAWGFDSTHWKGQEAEFTLGTYKDWNSGEDPPPEKETVKVCPISPAKTAEAQNGGALTSTPLPPSRVAPKNDLDDDIPFNVGAES